MIHKNQTPKHQCKEKLKVIRGKKDTLYTDKTNNNNQLQTLQAKKRWYVTLLKS